MEQKQSLPLDYTERAEIKIPSFGLTPEIVLDITKIKTGEGKILDARVVNPGTYNDLEYSFNEGYREAKKHISVIGYEITRAKKSLREAKSRAILDEYPDFLKENSLKDNATVRDAFLERQNDYTSAQDRIDMLTALESLMEGKVKNFENVCRYVRKQMDLIIRSGVDTNKYIR
jgi:hypothetical protein